MRNVKLLVEDLPWAHKPLLLALADLFSGIVSSPQSEPKPPQPSSGHGDAATSLTEGITIVDETGLVELSEEKGGVVVRNAAESLAPALLRPPPIGQDGRGAGEGMVEDGSVRTRSDWEEELAATAVVELILSEQNCLLQGVRAEQQHR